MAKMRVHELAKELNIKSQEILDVLRTTEYAVKSASSGIEEAAQNLVRGRFRKSGQQEAKKAEAPKQETPKESPKQETPKAAAKQESPKADGPKESQKQEASKQEAKADTPRQAQ